MQSRYHCAGEKGIGRLRSETEKAIEKLSSVKEEYLVAMRTGFNSLKDEYERNIEKGVLTLREEYSTVLDKINSLKNDCLKAVDHANALKDELINLFEQYSMFNRLQTREI